jgi:hypothetical protein
LFAIFFLLCGLSRWLEPVINKYLKLPVKRQIIPNILTYKDNTSIFGILSIENMPFLLFFLAKIKVWISG